MRYFLCFIFPPAAVLTTGRIGAFLLSILLTLFFWIPGIIHAVLVINDHYENRRYKALMKAIKRNNF